ncbi:MAG: alpha/beta hydrolase [Chthonomonadales bacterium]
MKLERLAIPSRGALLCGLLYHPRRLLCHAAVVIAHGYTASKASVDLLAAYICARGYWCLTFDFRGHKLGASTGTMERAEDALEDLGAAADWALGLSGVTGCVLAGHSIGGLAALVLAERRPDVLGVAAIAAGPAPTASFHRPMGLAMLSQRADYVEGAPPLEVFRGWDRLMQEWRGLGTRPALFVAAAADGMVKPVRVRLLADRCGPGAQFVEIDANHLEAPDRSRGVVADWLDRSFRGVTGPYATERG